MKPRGMWPDLQQTATVKIPVGRCRSSLEVKRVFMIGSTEVEGYSPSLVLLPNVVLVSDMWTI